MLSFSDCRKSKNKIIYKQFCLKAKNLIVKQCDNVTFAVSSDLYSYLYNVCTDTAICDWPYGQGGKLCKHLCAVENQFGIILKTAPLLSCEDKKDFARIAIGEDIETNFFDDMLSLDLVDEAVTTVSDERDQIVSSTELPSAGASKNEPSPLTNFRTVSDTALNRLSENFVKVVEILRKTIRLKQLML